MHLLTIAPLQHLLAYGVPEAKLELVRKFLGFDQKLKHNEHISFTLCNASDYFSSHPDIKLMLQNANRLCNTV